MRNEKGQFVKGHRSSPGTEFKKGHKRRVGLKHSPEARVNLSISHLGNKHSQATKDKMSLSRQGSKNHNWNGGRVNTSSGYIYLINASHPLSNKSGYVLEHRLVAEKHIGRFLDRQESVHHINNIHNDNSPENLFVFVNESEHQVFHRCLKHLPKDWLQSNLL